MLEASTNNNKDNNNKDSPAVAFNREVLVVETAGCNRSSKVRLLLTEVP